MAINTSLSCSLAMGIRSTAIPEAWNFIYCVLSFSHGPLFFF
ncbi:hypothetical protein V6Z12_D10G131900 [Gossypium hirsutum]